MLTPEDDICLHSGCMRAEPTLERRAGERCSQMFATLAIESKCPSVRLAT
jgi:hypothetical protein